MTRFQRLRWAALGVVIGVVMTVAAYVVASIVLPNPSDANVGDAGKLADEWAADHRRPGERYAGRDCAEDAGIPAYRFACWVRFEPTGRRFTLFMRTVAPNGEYEVALAQVRRGRHELRDFP
jgi:hypothetical protein